MVCDETEKLKYIFRKFLNAEQKILTHIVQNHPIDVDDAIMSVKYIEITVDSSKGLSRFINQLIA